MVVAVAGVAVAVLDAVKMQNESGREPVLACIGLGSNLDNPVVQIRTALDLIESLSDVSSVHRSGLYSNPPMGPQDQPDYVNAVALLRTDMEPLALLDALLGIEKQMGRDRDNSIHWGPRIIDLDLLVYGDETIDLPRLTVPHSGISERNFVLLPLAEIAPELNVPGQGEVRALAARFATDELRRLPED